MSLLCFLPGSWSAFQIECNQWYAASNGCSTLTAITSWCHLEYDSPTMHALSCTTETVPHRFCVSLHSGPQMAYSANVGSSKISSSTGSAGSKGFPWVHRFYCAMVGNRLRKRCCMPQELAKHGCRLFT